MNRTVIIYLIFLLLPLIQSCITSEKTMMRNDPLVGKIMDVKKQSSIDFDTLISRIKSFDVIYLSEKHDNPDHHKFQEKIIRSLIETGIKPAIGFEFFSMDNTPDLLNFIDSGKINHSDEQIKFIETDLRRKLEWDTQSDDMWSYYLSLLNIAKENNLLTAGIDLASNIKKRITRKGINGITALEAEQMFSTHFENKTYKDYMFSIFKDVHCGMELENMQSRLYDTWLARNDKMALSIVQIAKQHNSPVIIIIGGGHTRHGLGVIDRVTAINKDLTQVNIDLSEISTQPSDLSEYMSLLDLEGFAPSFPSDYMWFSQRVSYKDPCEEFRASLKKMRHSAGSK